MLELLLSVTVFICWVRFEKLFHCWYSYSTIACHIHRDILLAQEIPTDL
ncbi:putative signal peptide protein [Puccinia sorghi]|uniref:Putative signal peptide protein n=1 Tax=Puccinia sorghi TaxID=27349 RepID=A0A0L6VN59_9BASI|nr:putative signal peptide protein [Puccinia sorghi]